MSTRSTPKWSLQDLNACIETMLYVCNVLLDLGYSLIIFWWGVLLVFPIFIVLLYTLDWNLGWIIAAILFHNFSFNFFEILLLWLSHGHAVTFWYSLPNFWIPAFWKHQAGPVNNRRGKKNLFLSGWGDDSLLSEETINPYYVPDSYQSYKEQTRQNLVIAFEI